MLGDLSVLTPGWRLLADAAWQSTALLGAALLLARLVCRRPARGHAVILCGLAAALIVPPLAAASRAAGFGLLRGPDAAIAPAPAASPEWTSPTVGVDHAWPAAGTIGLILAVAWGAASTVLLLRLAITVIGTRRFVRRARPLADPAITRRLDAAVNRTEPRAGRRPVILMHDEIVAPASVALVGRHCLLVPSDVDRLSDAELTAIVAHELAHLRRRDHLGALLADGFVALLPWQPLGWLARRRTALLRELTCDAWAVRTVAAPAEYARLLCRFAARIAAPDAGRTLDQPPAALAMAAGHVRRRIDATLQTADAADGNSTEPVAGRRWLIGLIAISLLTVSVLALLHVRGDGPIDGPLITADGATTFVNWEDPKIVGASDGDRAAVLVSAREIDFGRVPAGETVERTLGIANPGPRNVIIDAIRAGCGCTRLEFDGPMTLQPGAAIELPVRMTADEDPDTTRRKPISLRVRGSRPLTVYVQIESMSEAEAAAIDAPASAPASTPASGAAPASASAAGTAPTPAPSPASVFTPAA